MRVRYFGKQGAKCRVWLLLRQAKRARASALGAEY